LAWVTSWIGRFGREARTRLAPGPLHPEIAHLCRIPGLTSCTMVLTPCDRQRAL
jgi:hypothetical protein